MSNQTIKLIGAAIDACAGTRGAADTPEIVNKNLQDLGLKFNEMIYYPSGKLNLKQLQTYFTQLAISSKKALEDGKFPVIIGGDHSCAIGTWSGISAALKDKSLGLIWLDAHMDAHTPETTQSGNIHGMPVAALLGYGYQELINILNRNPKLRPENIILIGIRSYEEGEANLLARLGVQVYFNYDIRERGFKTVFQEAWNKLATSVDKVGLSIDLDGFDPTFTPGVGTMVPDGIDFNHCLEELAKLDLSKLVGVEITEGNHHFDPSGKTINCIIDIINTVKGLN